jgi:excisionase family DNA binding protein
MTMTDTALALPDLTVKQAAAILNVHPTTFARWVRQGTVPHYRLPNGDDVRIRREDIDRIRGAARR